MSGQILGAMIVVPMWFALFVILPISIIAFVVSKVAEVSDRSRRNRVNSDLRSKQTNSGDASGGVDW